MKWKNIPIPEGHVGLLILGIVLQILYPLDIGSSAWILLISGAALLVAGISLTAWYVHEVNPIDIEAPEHLSTSGPYQFNRNPIYLAWSLIFLATSVVFHSLWLLGFFPLVLIYTHFLVILPEERQLEKQFGAEYRAYKSRVRRYI